MNGIQEVGKKWAKLIPILKNSKSEHMVKNRYHSLLKKKENEVKKLTKEEKCLQLIISDLTVGVEKERKAEKEREKEKKKEQEKEKGMDLEQDTGREKEEKVG